MPLRARRHCLVAHKPQSSRLRSTAKALEMSLSLTLRQALRLSTGAAATISLSHAIARLRSDYHQYKVHSWAFNQYRTATASSYPYDVADDKRIEKSNRSTDIETQIEARRNDPRITEEPYLSTLIRSYGRAGMFEQALKIYNQMDELGTPRTTISFNALLSACNVAKHFDQVPKLFDEIPQRHGLSPDKVSYGILVRSYCDSGSVELAMDILKSMEEKGIEITTITYTTILVALYKKEAIEEGNKLWNDMIKNGCSPDVKAYSVRMMNIQRGDTAKVNELFEEMRNAGLKPDTTTYNSLILNYCRSEKFDEAMKVYHELSQNGCRPNALTFKNLIYYLCKREEFDTGYDMFKKSVKARKVPGFSTLKHLVEGLVNNSKKKEAVDVIQTVKKMIPGSYLNDWEKLEEELDLAAAVCEDKDNEGDSAEATKGEDCLEEGH